jgi:hypothetical protein
MLNALTHIGKLTRLVISETYLSRTIIKVKKKILLAKTSKSHTK